MDIIVTDMTRFKNEDLLCIAGIDTATGNCIRPMPYLKADQCSRLNILPGAILRGDMIAKLKLDAPHTEDHTYENLDFIGPSSAEDFKSVLEGSLSASVEAGFGVAIGDKQKYIQAATPPNHSIITVKTDDVSIVEDKFNPDKFRIIFTDMSGKQYWFLSLTDLGFFNYAQDHNTKEGRRKVNSFLYRQQEVYLRIGLSRLHTSGERSGYWLQVNGIYTFPDYLKEIRCHS